MHGNVEVVRAGVDGPAAIGGAADRTRAARSQEHRLRAWLERNLAEPTVGVLPQRDDRRGVAASGGRLRCTIPNEVSVSTADPGSSASTLAYRAAHRDASCGPSSKTVMTTVGPTDRMTLGDLVVLREVLAHERDDRDLLADVT